MCLVGVPGEERDDGTGSVLDEMMTEDFTERMRHSSEKEQRRHLPIGGVVIQQAEEERPE